MPRFLTLSLVLGLLSCTKAFPKDPCRKILQNLLLNQDVAEIHNDAFPGEILNQVIVLRESIGETRDARKVQIEKLLKSSPAKDYFSEYELAMLADLLTASVNFKYSVDELLFKAFSQKANSWAEGNFSQLGFTTKTLIDQERTQTDTSETQRINTILNAIHFDPYIGRYRLSEEQKLALAKRLLEPEWKNIDLSATVAAYLLELGPRIIPRIQGKQFSAEQRSKIDGIRTSGADKFGHLKHFLKQTAYIQQLKLNSWDIAQITSELLKSENRGKSTESILDSIELR